MRTLFEAQAKRGAKETVFVSRKCGRKSRSSAPLVTEAKRKRTGEVEAAEGEIKALGLEITALF